MTVRRFVDGVQSPQSSPHNRPHADQPPMELTPGHPATVGANVRQLYRRARSTGDGQMLGIGNRLVTTQSAGTARIARWTRAETRATIPARDAVDRAAPPANSVNPGREYRVLDLGRYVGDPPARSRCR